MRILCKLSNCQNKLLASTAIATVKAGASASMEFYKNLCKMGFENYDANNNTVRNMRTLTFEYPYNGKMEQTSVPVLSLVPLTMLQVEDADFSFDVQVADMNFDETVNGSVEMARSSKEPKDILTTNNIPNLRIILLPSKESKNSEKLDNGVTPVGAKLSVHVKLTQSDMPGGMARFLQAVNNIDYSIIPNKPTNDSNDG